MVVPWPCLLPDMWLSHGHIFYQICGCPMAMSSAIFFRKCGVKSRQIYGDVEEDREGESHDEMCGIWTLAFTLSFTLCVDY